MRMRFGYARRQWKWMHHETLVVSTDERRTFHLAICYAPHKVGEIGNDGKAD
jgi:hypothetical protein